MIKLDIEEDNSEILEYVLKVAYKFYPMVYKDSKGIMHVGGTKADEEFEYYYNKGEVNFLSYNEYLNDEEIQANINALDLDVDKFYLLILFITHASKGQWENPYMVHVYPHTQVESFCETIIRELKSISDSHAEFSEEASITLKIGKKKIIVDNALAIAYIGTMADKMFDMVKMTRDFHSKGYDKKEEKDEFYKKLNALASPNVYTYYDGVNKKEITVNYNEALFSKAFDIDNLYESTSTSQTYLIGHFATMFDYFLKDYETPIRQSFTNKDGERIVISKYKLISKLIGLTKLTQNKKTDEDFLYDEGSKVKGYIAALKKAKIKTDNKFYDMYGTHVDKGPGRYMLKPGNTIVLGAGQLRYELANKSTSSQYYWPTGSLMYDSPYLANAVKMGFCQYAVAVDNGSTASQYVNERYMNTAGVLQHGSRQVLVLVKKAGQGQSYAPVDWLYSACTPSIMQQLQQKALPVFSGGMSGDWVFVARKEGVMYPVAERDNEVFLDESKSHLPVDDAIYDMSHTYQFYDWVYRFGMEPRSYRSEVKSFMSPGTRFYNQAVGNNNAWLPGAYNETGNSTTPNPTIGK